ncbi:Uncharacterised protein at_DN0716 [Pycnogonum litorale]
MFLNDATISHKMIPTTENRHLPGLGLILGSISGVFYALHALFIRLLRDNVSPIVITFFRSITLMIVGIAIILMDFRNVQGMDLRALLFLISSGLISLIIEFTMSSSLQMISLSDSLTIYASSPVFASIIGSIISRKLPTRKEVIIIVVTVVGVVFCIQPDFIFHKAVDKGKKIGYLYALISSLMVASLFHMTRAFTHLHIGTSCFLMFMTATTLSVSYMTLTRTFTFPTETMHVIYLVLMASFAVCATFTRFYGIKFDDATMVSVGRTSDVIVALFVEIFVFKTIPNVLRVGGACLIILAIIMPVVTNL